MEKKDISILESPDLFEEQKKEEEDDVCFLVFFNDNCSLFVIVFS